MMEHNPFSKADHPYCWMGHSYALDVVDGKIIASVWTIGACKRYLRDMEQEEFHKDFYFNVELAEKYLRLVQKFEHVIGKWDTKNIVYEPWQCWVWMNIMGFINRRTGFRRFRTAHIEIARGNAKSAMASQAALYFMALDDPNGNQVATAATKKEQARIVLDSARAMARKNKSFERHFGVRVLAHSIVQDKTNSVIRALSAEASSLDGLNDVLAVCDELHAMKRDTYDVISSGMSKRKDSLILCITTAGFDIESVGYSQSEYAKKVCLGEQDDETFFAVVYSLDKEDEKNIYDQRNWIKANPNLGVSVDLEGLQAKAAQTRVKPQDVPNFKVKHLNLWISQLDPFYNVDTWDKCADPTLKMEDFKRIPAKMAIDLASHIDLTCIGLIFEKDGVYNIFVRSYIPEDTLKDSENDLYHQAVESGDLIVTPGAAINNDFIRADAEKLAKEYRIDECAYDSWNATEMSQKLANKIEMVKFGMNVGNMSEPMKMLGTLAAKKKLRHNGSKLLRWSIGNVVAKRDHNENVFPRKTHVRLKIDPVITMIMALALHLQNEVKESVYGERGIRVLT